jgi:hypothetical protein
MDYSTLLLYEYADEQRHSLAPFRWQSMSRARFAEVEQWIRSGRFPGLLGSEAIITQLGSAEIGTDDRVIIDEWISPRVRETLVIKVGWPPGHEPPAQVRISVRWEQEQQQRVVVYRD